MLIQEVVAAHYKVNYRTMYTSGRHHAVAYPRMVAMFLSRELTAASFPILGYLFGNRHHSTVHSAVAKVEHLRDTDPLVRAVLEKLRDEITCKAKEHDKENS